MHRCSLDSAEIFCCCYFKMGFLMVAYRIFFLAHFFMHIINLSQFVCLFCSLISILI